MKHIMLVAIALVLGVLALAQPAFAKNGVSAIWEPVYNQLEVFTIGDDGAVHVVWKGKDGYWHQPQRITKEKMGVPNSELLALWHVQNDQLEVFWVDANGALVTVVKDHNGAWHTPDRLTGPGFAVPGSPITGFWQPTYHQLYVFGIAANGAVNTVFKANNGRWSAVAQMSGPRTAAVGSKPVAFYQPSGEQSQLLFTASNGSVMLTWKGKNGPWGAPKAVTAPGIVGNGGWLDAAVYREPAGSYEQVEVFFTDRNGALNVVWKNRTDIANWRTQTISKSGYSPAGAPLSAAVLPAGNYLEVFSLAGDGHVNDVWKTNNGRWSISSTTSAGVSPAGNTVSAVVLPNPQQLEVFYKDARGALWVSWKPANGYWQPPQRLTNDAGASKVTSDYCLAYWRDWYAGKRKAELNMAVDCRPFVPNACRWWHMSNPPAYIYNSDNQILMLMYSRQRDKSLDTFRETIDANGNNHFSGPILVHQDFLGNTDGQLHGSMNSGLFNVYTGRVVFLAYLWEHHMGDGTVPTARYGGVVTELIADPYDSGRGTVYASMEGSFFWLNGKHPGGWNAPYPNHAPMAFCNKDDLAFLPAPKPIKKTGQPRQNAPAAAPADRPIKVTGVPRDTFPPVVVSPPPVIVAPPPEIIEAPPPPVSVLPQGQCPAPTARVTTGVNIRDGIGTGGGGEVIGQAASGTRVQCVACNNSWCQIAANPPGATVSRKYLDFELPQAAQVTPPDRVDTSPVEAPVRGANFAGDWNVRTSTGLSYRFHIEQKGKVAGGTFGDSMVNGSFTGAVDGDVLTLQWGHSAGMQGAGTFRMHRDGAGFDGQFNVALLLPRVLQPIYAPYAQPGTWETYTPASAGPRKTEPPRPVDFTGRWYVRTSQGAVFTFDITQKDNYASGSITDPIHGSYGFSGAPVEGNVLTLNWGAPTYVGGGTFKMHADGKSFDGEWHAGTVMVRPGMPVNQAYEGSGTWATYTPPSPRYDPSKDVTIDYGGCATCGVDRPDPVR